MAESNIRIVKLILLLLNHIKSHNFLSALDPEGNSGLVAAVPAQDLVGAPDDTLWEIALWLF